jgi:predicted aspartyl protease
MKNLSFESRKSRRYLSEIREILGTGSLKAVEEKITSFEQTGDRAVATILRIMSAAQRRDAAVVDALTKSDDAKSIRQDPILQCALILSLYWGRDLAATFSELEKFRADDAELPDSWVRDIRQLKAFKKEIGERRHSVDLPTTSEVPFASGQSLLVIQASLNNLPPAFFIVDTGAPTTVLSAEYAREAGIKFDETNYKESQDGSGSKIKLYPAVLEELAVGSAVARNCPVHVMELSKRLGVKGIISPFDSFRGSFTEFDMRASVLRIRPPHSLSQWLNEVEAPTWSEEVLWNEGSPSVRVELLKEHQSFFLIDSGAGANLLCAEFCRQVGLDFGEPHAESTTAAGQTTIYRGHFANLSVGGSSERLTEFLVKHCEETTDKLFPSMFDGYLGVPWFKGRRVAFSADGRFFYFTEPAED